ncbi:MAG: HEAT repeat domain-containing protein, partial [Planctomycetaceae bacterium]|nr:HEAT repeat domain-containing protein [Planctomycetaceae bacterium]
MKSLAVFALGLIALGLALVAWPAGPVAADEPFVLPQPDRLVESLRSGDWQERTQIIAALGKQTNAAAYEPVLRAALKDADRSVRQMAAIGLVQLGGVQLGGVQLGGVQLGQADQPVLDELIRGMGHPWKPVYTRAPDDPHAARAALVQLGDKAVPALAAALVGENRQARLLAVHALMDIGPAAKEALPALAQALRTRPSECPVAILEARYRIDGDAAAAIRGL